MDWLNFQSWRRMGDEGRRYRERYYLFGWIWTPFIFTKRLPQNKGRAHLE